MTEPQFDFTDDVPKATRGRAPHEPTVEDKGITALVARGSGAITVPVVADDLPKIRRQWQQAARRANVTAKTVYNNGTLYISLKTAA